MNQTVSEILGGSYDLHVHAGPDGSQEMRFDALETARHAYEYEMGGFVFISHEYPTASLAYALNAMYPGLAVSGSICLNKAVGGLNADAVLVAARMGARTVWMPTIDADHITKCQGRGPGIRLLDDIGKLRPEVISILEVVKTYDLVIASGNVSPLEAYTLFKAATEKGIDRKIVTYVSGVHSTKEQKEMVSLGVQVEYKFSPCMPIRRALNVDELIRNVRKLGIDHCLITTGFGQWFNPSPAEGMRMAIAALLSSGMSAEEVTVLVKDNPSRLLN